VAVAAAIVPGVSEDVTIQGCRTVAADAGRGADRTTGAGACRPARLSAKRSAD
jgi:hypothetical protein